MLYYCCVDRESVKKVARKGIKEKVTLQSVVEVDPCESGAIVVVDPLRLELEKRWYGKETLSVSRVPAEAIQNVKPYKKPRLVIAGGGFVMKNTPSGREIILIKRKGKWDIPKGKLDKGEAHSECAVREVQEEIGINDVRVVQELGSTWHCYERKEKFCIKRTYWYEMNTTDTSFYPQEEEDIEEVAWFPWAKAKDIVGFPLFRMHMEHVEHLVMK